MHRTEESQLSKCQRCGTCCKKGGPALHIEDQPIIDRGGIPVTSLFTLRKGERAFDNINGGMIRLTEEIIKIKSVPGAAVCMYFNEADMSCRIYDHRPVECRTLECWNTGKIKAIYAQTRLTRALMVQKITWLAELVQTHEDRCSLERIQDLVQDRASDDPAAASKLAEIINYDFHLRHLAAEKGGLPSEMADFLFGRPLAEIIPNQFGVNVRKTD